MDIPVPNPPPLPSDLPPPRLISPRAALRRSLVVWGWGQLAAGDRRGWLGPPLQVVAFGGLAILGGAASRGTNASLVYASGGALLAVWIGIAVHAYRLASRRRRALDADDGLAGSDSAADLLWFGPLILLASTAFWILGAREGDPAFVLDAYVADWRDGRPAAAVERFVSPPSEAVLSGTWERQLAALRNDLVHLAATAGAGSGIDPDHPLDSIRWVDVGPTSDGRGTVIALEIARRDTVRGQLLGFLPTSSQRLVTLERLGTVELRAVPLGGPAGDLAGSVWRIAIVDVSHVAITAPG